jgi:hypothetical protein
MIMTGMYRIALLPEADEKRFIDHMRSKVFDVLQLTRVTRGFTHTLLKSGSDFRQYVWLAAVDLVGDGDYNFGRNRERVQEAIAEFGLLVGIDSFLNLEGQ